MHLTQKLKVAVVGAQGYAGLELCRILLRHPGAELVACFSRTPESFRLKDELPEAHQLSVPVLGFEDLTQVQSTSAIDTIFLATPVEASLEVVSMLLKRKLQIIDLSGAFRLNAEEFHKWYGLPHTVPTGINQATYGLVPHSRVSTNTRLLANPGCYATSVLLALIPLLISDLIRPESVVIDAKSGTSGAGRKAQESLLFNEVDGAFRPYRIGAHPHFPEIVRHAKLLTGKVLDPIFTTSLMPARRGIVSSIYARLNSDCSNQGEVQARQQIENAYDEAYKNYPLVRVKSLEGNDLHDAPFLALRKVVGSARTHLGFHISGDKLSVFSLIDNLLKGAASQAIENWNIMQGYPSHTGLVELEGVL